MVDIAINAIPIIIVFFMRPTFAYEALLVSANVFAIFPAAFSDAVDASVERLLTILAEEFTLAFYMPLRICLCPRENAHEVRVVCLICTAALLAIPVLKVQLFFCCHC